MWPAGSVGLPAELFEGAVAGASAGAAVLVFGEAAAALGLGVGRADEDGGADSLPSRSSKVSSSPLSLDISLKNMPCIQQLRKPTQRLKLRHVAISVEAPSLPDAYHSL